MVAVFFFSSRRRHTRFDCDWSSDVCSSDLEYQAKELLSGFDVPVPRGGVAYSAEQAVYRAAEIGGDRWVVKAQIHAGARGKAGGIRVGTSDGEGRGAAKGLLGRNLLPPQPGPQG